MDPYATRIRRELRSVDRSLHQVNNFIFHYEEIILHQGVHWERALSQLLQLEKIKKQLIADRTNLLRQIY